jgi:hypothetical protein
VRDGARAGAATCHHALRLSADLLVCMRMSTTSSSRITLTPI